MSDLSKYQILNLVAKGGTAVLYSAVQTSLDRVVAIKKLHQHLTEDDNFTRRFILEAKAAASLDHENIVKIIDFGMDNDGYHMVMEFIEGESLRGIVDKWKQIPVDLALSIAYHVCQGLEHAHAKGIVHRDIKPGNIMVTNSGRVKITDFGLAKLTQQTTQHTAANSILGTPLYMSPEQAFGESVDQRSDLFSLGTMLYEMITGVQPFRDEHYMGVIQNIINKNAPHPSRFDMDLPPEVQSILSKSMNKSREARFQTAGDFKKAIEKHLGLLTLKESRETLCQILHTEGETIVLPRTLAVRKRSKRLRRGFAVALLATMIFGGAAIGYRLAPDRFQQHYQSAMTWLDDKNLLPNGRGADVADVMNANTTLGVDPYINALQSDTMATAADSTAKPRLAPEVTPIVEEAPTQVAEPAAQPEPRPDVPVEASNGTPAPVPAVYPPTVATERRQPEMNEEPAPVEKPAKVQTGWVSITAETPVDVYIDGAYRGDASPNLRLELSSGRHRLECQKSGHVPYTETIHITTGEFSNRSIALKKLQGTLRITTMPGAEIYVDGKFIGVTPLGKTLDLDAGTHQVTVKKVGFNAWNNQITINADETLPLSIVLSPQY